VKSSELTFVNTHGTE